MTVPATLRPIRPADGPAVARIAYATGFFGRSASVYFPDAALFGALWVQPYLDGAGAGGFVAEVGHDVVGYILGAPEHARYQRALAGAALRHVTTTVPTRATLQSVPYVLRAGRFPSPHADWAAFPAHLHLNLLPTARGTGVGRRLLDAHLTALGGLDVPGVQLSTTTENDVALRLYRRAGFTVLASRTTPLWTPWLGRPATHVLMGRRSPGRDLDPASPD